MDVQPALPAVARRLRDLCALRQRKGISLEQIAQSTKIRLFYLQAIEEGKLEKLPSGIFTVSYLRQYARAIGCPERELLTAYAGSLPS